MSDLYAVFRCVLVPTAMVGPMVAGFLGWDFITCWIAFGFAMMLMTYLPSLDGPSWVSMSADGESMKAAILFPTVMPVTQYLAGWFISLLAQFG